MMDLFLGMSVDEVPSPNITAAVSASLKSDRAASRSFWKAACASGKA